MILRSGIFLKSLMFFVAKVVWWFRVTFVMPRVMPLVIISYKVTIENFAILLPKCLLMRILS